VIALRRQYRERAASIRAERLVFIDESGATTAMTRTRGRAPRGERVHGSAPHGHWKVTTMIGAIRLSGIAAAMTVDSPTDSEVFCTFVERVLVPTLKPGDIVVMDNLSPHKACGVEEMITAAKAELWYLPPYSPDYNPIEPCWSKIKEFLRSAKARTQRKLERVIARALRTVSLSDALGWFKECGYIGH
jgi:transposase